MSLKTYAAEANETDDNEQITITYVDACRLCQNIAYGETEPNFAAVREVAVKVANWIESENIRPVSLTLTFGSADLNILAKQILG